jgi:L-ribulose-5-phosphate 4-epimerase
MLESLKQEVCEANLELVRRDLVLMTWGNASGIDRAEGLVVIKPSGVGYDTMQPEDMAVVDLGGRQVEGRLKPSVDTPAHLALYNAFESVGAVVHTHSHYATIWAQACRPIPCLGTTHADHFYGEVPVTEPLTEQEVATDYERHIGEAIVHRFGGLDPTHFPGVLCAQHAPFTWGTDVAEAVHNAVALEEIARMALHTIVLSPDQSPIDQHLLDKHFLRKHGEDAYYGQRDA